MHNVHIVLFSTFPFLCIEKVLALDYIFPTTAKLNPHEILSERGKSMNTKESWYKSNFIVVGSNFNSSYYYTQAEKCLGNSTFNSKGRFLFFFFQNEGKKESLSLILMDWSYEILLKISLIISKVLREPTFGNTTCSTKQKSQNPKIPKIPKN